MRALGTFHGRVLALWSFAIGGWMLAQVMALFGVSWHSALIGLVAAAVFASCLAAFARRAFRHAVARPLRRRGLNGWLGGRPWRVAVMVVVANLIIPAAVFGSQAYLYPAPGGFRISAGFVAAIGAWVTFAVGVAAFWILVFGQQRQAAWQQASYEDHTIESDVMPDQG